MKKAAIVVLLFLSLCTRAQWVDLSAMYGIAPYRISAGIKNNVSGIYNVSLSFVKLKVIALGVQFSGMSTITLCSVMSPGIFAEYVIQAGEKNIITLGVHDNLMLYGDIPAGGHYFDDQNADTSTIKLDNTNSYGVRAGYKRALTDYIWASILVSPTYSTSPIHIGSNTVKNCALFSVPVMLGISVRL